MEAEQTKPILPNLGGHEKMMKEEYELMKTIRESEDVEGVLLTALRIFSAFAEQPEEAPALRRGDLPESV